MTTNNPDAPIRMGEPPVPGFYIKRLVRGGPWVGCRITLDADGYRVMRDGVWQGPSHNPWLLSFMEEVNISKRVDEAEVKFRLGIKRWAEIYRPDAPEANPTRPINLDTFTPI